MELTDAAKLRIGNFSKRWTEEKKLKKNLLLSFSPFFSLLKQDLNNLATHNCLIAKTKTPLRKGARGIQHEN